MATISARGHKLTYCSRSLARKRAPTCPLEPLVRLGREAPFAFREGQRVTLTRCPFMVMYLSPICVQTDIHILSGTFSGSERNRTSYMSTCTTSCEGEPPGFFWQGTAMCLKLLGCESASHCDIGPHVCRHYSHKKILKIYVGTDTCVPVTLVGYPVAPRGGGHMLPWSLPRTGQGREGHALAVRFSRC